MDLFLAPRKDSVTHLSPIFGYFTMQVDKKFLRIKKKVLKNSDAKTDGGL